MNAQNDGLWQGYHPAWGHVSGQLMALANAIPAKKFAWRPAPGVRSLSEVIMHAALANFYLLQRSLEAVKAAHAALKPYDLARKVKIAGKPATVDGIYLRIIVHANEHMGQLVAYARMIGVVPPWSKSGE